MQQPTPTSYTISDFLEWQASRQLVLTPKFQRRDVWAPKAKSFLIDTILRFMPIPPLFIRLTVDPVQRRTVREVVDGQQRLRAVLSFIQGEFPLLKVHNSTYGSDVYYSDLPEDVQKKFLGYHFLVNLLQDVSDAEVLGIFARINTYTVKLVSQELRNAQFFGAFKQAIYNLAHRHYAFWRNNRIISDAQISRMADAELVSELVVSMLDGIRQTKAKDLELFYKTYDDEFPQSEKASKEFDQVIDIIGNILGDKLVSSQFRRVPMFYTLFLAIYDAKFGLPNSNYPRISFSSKQNKIIVQELLEIDKFMNLKEPPNEYRTFTDASRLSTADVGKRRMRHVFIWENVLQKAVELEN